MERARNNTASPNVGVICPIFDLDRMWAKRNLSVELARAEATELKVAFKGFFMLAQCHIVEDRWYLIPSTVLWSKVKPAKYSGPIFKQLNKLIPCWFFVSFS